jgi:alanine-synthesizing transaminase
VSVNLAELDKQLAGQRACSRFEVEGGWNAVIRVPVTRSDEKLALELLATKGVYVHPGHFYDFPSEGTVVLSLIPPENDFSKGLRQLLLLF